MENHDDIDELVEDLRLARQLCSRIADRYPGDKNVQKLNAHIDGMYNAAIGVHEDDEKA